MKRCIILAAFAALAAFGAEDDAHTANHKWVRAQIESALQGVTRTGRTYPSLVAQTENTYTFKADVANGTNDVDLTIKLVAPTNAALFVAWSTCTNVPARTYYAKVPNQQLYVNATNAFLPSISYAVEAHTTATNRNGRTVYAFTQTTRWSATDARGGAWAMAYRGGDTVLFNAANTNEYIVIRNTTISDAKKAALLSNYVANAASAPPRPRFSFLSLFVSSAYAEPGVEVERGGGTLGYHSALEIGEVTVETKRGEKTYYLPDDGRDHQYNPNSGRDHADLDAEDAYYLTYEMVADPLNWGFQPVTRSGDEYIEMVDENGNSYLLLWETFVTSDAWLDAVAKALEELPKANVYNEVVDVDDPTEHECKVYDAEGNHIGCVCDWPNCEYCPNCNTEYEVRSEWTDGRITTEKKTLKFSGARHNWQNVLQDVNGDDYSDASGCMVCYQEAGKHFCGNGALNNVSDEHDLTHHYPNDPDITGRAECGCLCRKYAASVNGTTATVPTTDMHIQQYGEGGAEITHAQQDSSCWCYCRRMHNGAFYGAKSENGCPNHCTSCGCYRTYDGEEVNGVHPDPLEYRITDDGEAPTDTEGHEPSTARCGCKCGAISPDNDETYPLMKEDKAFHHTPEHDCTCTCKRRFHVVYNETGHCPDVCTLCGLANHTVVDEYGDEVEKPEAPLYTDHVHMSGHCGCECYYHNDGHKADGAAYCGFKGTENADIADDSAWHERKDATHCCCECGIYADHRGKNGAHSEWFISSACELVCGGINSSGVRCGKVITQDRAAKWYEHDPADTGCGCRCHAEDSQYGFSGGEAGMKDDGDYHHRDGSTCHCVCQANHDHHSEWFTPSACPNICAGCGKLRDGSDPAISDHTPKESGCGCKCGELNNNVIAVSFHNGHNLNMPCRCECGILHKWYNGSTARCQVCSTCHLTEGGSEPTDETLHTLNAETNTCACYCGYFSPGAHTATREALHLFDGENTYGVSNCVCVCGGKHVFRSSTVRQRNAKAACDGICAYCDTLKADGTTADDSEHTPCEVSHAHCGCRGGKLTANSTSLAKFHIRKPGTCRCFGSDGTGGAWHFHDPKAGCVGICYYQDVWGITGEHTVAGAEKENVPPVAATVANHTKTTSATCGCACGKYTSSNWTQWNGIKNFHNTNPTDCGCYCTHASESQVTPYHKWLDPTTHCKCFCEQKHAPIADPDCPKICRGGCNGTVADMHVAPTVADHTPKDSGGCGCKCGDIDASTSNLKFHQVKNPFPPYCFCYCGRHHNHSDKARADCQRLCAGCTDVAQGRFYLVGKDPREGASDADHSWDDYCTCACGGKTRTHDWSDAEQTGNTTNFICVTCSEYINGIEYGHHCKRKCSRDGSPAAETWWEYYGHNWNLHVDGDEQDGQATHYCTKHGITYTGSECPKCKKEREAENASTDIGGYTGGSGGDEDI